MSIELISMVLWITWHPLELLFIPVWVIIGALSGLSLVNPELAFRYENIFQLRDVELSSFGVVLQVGGGILVLLIVGPYFFIQTPSFGIVSLLTLYGGAIVALIRHWPPKW